jgi:putative Holliday junction resolvase
VTLNPAESFPGRVVALDYGQRRIGVAATDPSRTIASPHGAVRNSDPPDVPPEALIHLLTELEPSVIILGIPVHADGTAGAMAGEARRFGAHISSITGVPVTEWDERFTSVEASEMILELDLPRKKRREKGLRDALAALLILREYLSDPTTE